MLISRRKLKQKVLFLKYLLQKKIFLLLNYKLNKKKKNETL